ncbi:MAG: precorrin-2 C(20)-methyltransferase [Thaumarchaeota archaeon S15]|nr:precorrin-2 C(20)-methyltransferase [Nitrososphaerota archaeon]RNJ71636.1 MAG: precorrin-2 C(20)-methyltransferase [Thaumarchaeota archaeon S13]RNJ73510.1 MAG: precorrin-2 C(20)-methyltransferase [Thaumarchaeota archaeon S15]
MARLTAIGCGPGDPDLITIKAKKAIDAARTILCPASREDRPSIALSIARPLIDPARGQRVVKLVFPMTRDPAVLEETWDRNAEEMAREVEAAGSAVYLTVGDPYLYSTWMYLHARLSRDHPEIEIDVVPGIVSAFMFASRAGMSLAEGAEKLTIVPSCYDLTQVRELARSSDTMVFLKDGQYFGQVIELLREAGYAPDSPLAIGQDLGTERERVTKTTLGEVDADTSQMRYFSILMVRRARNG